MNSDDIKRKLELERDKLTSLLSDDAPEAILNLQAWYDACDGIVKLKNAEKAHYEYLDMRGMVALSGSDLPLIQSYIDEYCIILVPKKSYSEASASMDSSRD